MNNLPLILLGGGIAAYALSKATKKDSFGTVNTNPTRKFPGYKLIDSQLLIITDSKKAKEFVFNTGKTKPEGALFELVFGRSIIIFSDVKKDPRILTSSVYLTVKNKEQQDNVYFLLSYLFAGAYIQSPHRVGYYADELNRFISYVKKMFDTDYPLIKSLDEAKLFFENLANKIN